jgi:hypothetical protein
MHARQTNTPGYACHISYFIIYSHKEARSKKQKAKSKKLKTEQPTPLLANRVHDQGAKEQADADTYSNLNHAIADVEDGAIIHLGGASRRVLRLIEAFSAVGND